MYLKRQYNYMVENEGMNPAMLPDGTVIANYDNPDVISIREQLGDFDYGAQPQDTGRVEYREMVLLENGAKYEGFWLVNVGIRQG
jgi:hypothetical protein